MKAKRFCFLIYLNLLTLLAGVLFFGVFVKPAQAAILSVGPAAGTFVVGSTFEVSVLLNTEGKLINAIEASLSFPPDKLQLVSPSTGKSVIGIWTVQPNVNNQGGRIDLQGGIPGGVNVSSGLVTTLTFRAKSVGTAVIRFLDNSRVLLNDGKGTNDLSNTVSGVYNLVLPPPAGPIVSSETHPDQSIWYSNPNVLLVWSTDEKVEGFSYILNSNPVITPDDIIDNTDSSVTYHNLADGVHYFHIKALREGKWGGITHFAFKIDTTPPAGFSIEVLPVSTTVRRQPIIQFVTTDADSGIDHYELKLLSLQPSGSGQQLLFIEVSSPYVPEPLELGKYQIIARAFDKAGNYRETIKDLSIIQAIFTFISSDGLQIKSRIIIPWFWVWSGAVVLVAALWFIGRRLRHWYSKLDSKRLQKNLPSEIQEKLKELAKFKEKYDKVIILILVLGVSLLFGRTAKAIDENNARTAGINPPIITLISSNISNEEIFYVGGKTEVLDSQIIIYLQNITTGETFSYNAVADKKGEWFYSHDKFLFSGNYLLWVQNKLADELSPPSPQKQITVRPTAIQLGSSRLSYETIYLVLIIIFGLIICGLLSYIIFHLYHGRRKHKLFSQEIKQAEELVRREFAMLRRDIEAELAVIEKIKLKGVLSIEEKSKEEQLLKDLGEVEKHIGEEIWDLEKMGQKI